MPINLAFVPNAAPKSGAPTHIALEDIPADVVEAVEETYVTLKQNDGRVGVEFPTVADLNSFVTYVKAYCELRPAGKLHYRKSPARGLKPNQMQFRITDVPENEEITQGIRDGVAAVKSAAKK